MCSIYLYWQVYLCQVNRTLSGKINTLAEIKKLMVHYDTCVYNYMRVNENICCYQMPDKQKWKRVSHLQASLIIKLLITALSGNSLLSNIRVCNVIKYYITRNIITKFLSIKVAFLKLWNWYRNYMFGFAKLFLLCLNML